MRLYVWDTAGQERFRHIARMYYKDVSGVLLCYDLTDEESFKNLTFWLSDLKNHGPEKLAKIMVGNKLDLCDPDLDSNDSFISKREVGFHQANEFARSNSMQYVECSAKSGINVNEVFQQLVFEINKQNDGDGMDASRQSSVLDDAI